MEGPMTKPVSRSDLSQKLELLEHNLAGAAQARDTYRAELIEKKQEIAAIEKRNTQLKAQFDDLKERLLTAEAENQRMRGYIQRVQEDDIVREELVQIGDPEGATQLVSKRKMTQFSEPNNRSEEHTSELQSQSNLVCRLLLE